jgi:hypothetical protein
MVGLIDQTVAVAVGGQTCPCLANRTAPDDVVGSIDAAVLVVIPRPRGFRHDDEV